MTDRSSGGVSGDNGSMIDCELEKRIGSSENLSIHLQSSPTSPSASTSTGASSGNQNAQDLPLSASVETIARLVNKDDVRRMINIQTEAIDNLERTNKDLTECNNLAQAKLVTTAKLFKKTARHMTDAKKDLDVIYKKILEMKAKIQLQKPHLFERYKQPSEELEERDVLQTSSNANQLVGSSSAGSVRAT